MLEDRPISRKYAKHPRDMTVKERIAWMRSVEGLQSVEADLIDSFNLNETIPREWNDIWQGRDGDTKRVKVTLTLDADVVRFFKSMGPGYQPRMNTVLRSFMHARLAKMINGPEAAWYVDDPEIGNLRLRHRWHWRE
ncbi:MAG: BrnA antitoxin family protein [Pseudomonadota bacterium]